MVPFATRQASAPAPFLGELLEPFGGRRSQRTAQRLLEVFGSLDRTMTASDQQIVAACGEDRDIGLLIAAARRLVEAGLCASVTRAPVDCNDVALERYLALKFNGRPVEELHAIFVDDGDGFIAEEIIAAGGTSFVNANLSHILRRTMELGAAGLILFHNHPSRNPGPSVEDVRSTQRVAETIAAIGVRLIDHLIIAGQSVSSMKRLGLL